MSCNTKTSLAAVIDAVNAQLNNNYIDRDDPRINQGVFTEPTIRGGLMLDEAAKLDFCGYVTECGQREPFGKQWVDRPLYPHNTLVSYEDEGEIKSRWQDIDDVVAGTEIGESYITYEETRSLGLQGYTIIDSFELGETITQRNQALRHAATGKLYRWAGDLPKIVPAGSTPDNSGGVDTNAWLEVGDAALRQEILTGGLITDTLVTVTANGVGTIDRILRDVRSEYKSLKDFGAVGDGVTDDSVAVQAAFNYSGVIYVPDGVYLVKTPIFYDPEVDGKNGVMLKLSDNLTLIGGANVEIRFDIPDKAVRVPASIKSEGKNNIRIANIKFFGYSNASGIAPTRNHRAWGVGIYGGDNISFTNCEFNGFEGHNLHVNRSRQGEDWIVDGEYNSQASVDALLALSASNVVVRDSRFNDAGSNCAAAFGVNGFTLDNCEFNTAGGLYRNAFFTDDASSATPLVDYAVNDKVIINNCRTDGDISAGYCATSIISNCFAREISHSSYDADQQINNLAVKEERLKPFLWLNYFNNRYSKIENNICNKIRSLSSNSVDIKGNTVISNGENTNLIELSYTAFSWGGGAAYFDVYNEDASQKWQNPPIVTDNILVARHVDITGITYNLNGIGHTSFVDLSNVFTVHGEGTFKKYVNSPSNSRMGSEYTSIVGGVVDHVDFRPTDFKNTLKVKGVDVGEKLKGILSNGTSFEEERGLSYVKRFSLGSSATPITLFKYKASATGTGIVNFSVKLLGTALSSEPSLYSIDIVGSIDWAELIDEVVVEYSKHTTGGEPVTATLNISVVEEDGWRVVKYDALSYATGLLDVSAVSRQCLITR